MHVIYTQLTIRSKIIKVIYTQLTIIIVEDNGRHMHRHRFHKMDIIAYIYIYIVCVDMT